MSLTLIVVLVTQPLQVNLRSPWWLDVLQRAIQYSIDDDLVSRIQSELTCSYKQQAHKLTMADK